MAQANDDTVFKDLNADDAEQGTTEVESCCMNCYKNVSSNQIENCFKKYHLMQMFYQSSVGHNSFAADKNSILQRDHFDVIFVRALWL